MDMFNTSAVSGFKLDAITREHAISPTADAGDLDGDAPTNQNDVIGSEGHEAVRIRRLENNDNPMTQSPNAPLTWK